MKKIVALFVAVLCSAVFIVRAQEHAASKIVSTPEWEKMKSLVGEWDGYTMADGKKYPTHISIRMTGDGSALMHCMDPGGPHEMITMFHTDQADLVATHYCAAHNQPRFRAVPSNKPDSVVFQFKDGTNIRPGDGFMSQLTITFVDADHHNETWGYDNKGKVETGTFFLSRVPKR